MTELDRLQKQFEHQYLLTDDEEDPRYFLITNVGMQHKVLSTSKFTVCIQLSRKCAIIF